METLSKPHKGIKPCLSLTSFDFSRPLHTVTPSIRCSGQVVLIRTIVHDFSVSMNVQPRWRCSHSFAEIKISKDSTITVKCPMVQWCLCQRQKGTGTHMSKVELVKIIRHGAYYSEGRRFFGFCECLLSTGTCVTVDELPEQEIVAILTRSGVDCAQYVQKMNQWVETGVMPAHKE